MEGRTKMSILLLIISFISTTSALEARKVLHIPEKILGGVIDLVQSHKNKPTQSTTTVQTQAQQQVYQGHPQQYAPWSTGYQIQGQAQYQGQYAPQSGYTYPQAGYVYPQVYPSGQQTGGSQASQGQEQYQTYPQIQTGNQFQGQNLQGTFENQQTNQYQNQVQNAVLGQQVQTQNQHFQNQNHQTGQYVNQNQPTHTNFQGVQQVGNQQNYHNQPTSGFVTQLQPTGSYGGHQQSTNFAGNQQSSNFAGQTQPTNNYVGQNQPQGQVTQPTYVGQHHQSSHFQGQPSNPGVGPGLTGSNSGGFQISTGHSSGAPGPTCVCQAWTKPPNGKLNDTPSQRNEEKVEKSE